MVKEEGLLAEGQMRGIGQSEGKSGVSGPTKTPDSLEVLPDKCSNIS